MEVLSNNIANAQTPGFKRELAVLQARHAEAIIQGEDYPGTRGTNNVGGGVFMAETMTDFRGGTLKPTGQKTDAAIDGEGFFMVKKDNENYLTRAGNFSITNDGRLIGPGNSEVLDDSGQPIVIDISDENWKIDPSGAILQNGDIVNLAIVKPRSFGDLAKAGENLFKPLAPTLPVEPDQRQVRAGYLELSGANPIAEMTQLIEASRAYEANVRMIQNHDQILGALTGRLLKA